MHISEALKQQVYIECNNEVEKATVVNILTLNGVKYEPLLGGSGDYISLFRLDNSWGFCNSYDASFPMVSAIDFIRSNTPQTTNDNTPSPHSMNIL